MQAREEVKIEVQDDNVVLFDDEMQEEEEEEGEDDGNFFIPEEAEEVPHEEAEAEDALQCISEDSNHISLGSADSDEEEPRNPSCPRKKKRTLVRGTRRGAQHGRQTKRGRKRPYRSILATDSFSRKWI